MRNERETSEKWTGETEEGEGTFKASLWVPDADYLISLMLGTVSPGHQTINHSLTVTHRSGMSPIYRQIPTYKDESVIEPPGSLPGFLHIVGIAPQPAALFLAGDAPALPCIVIVGSAVAPVTGGLIVDRCLVLTCRRTSNVTFAFSSIPYRIAWVVVILVNRLSSSLWAWTCPTSIMNLDRNQATTCIISPTTRRAAAAIRTQPFVLLPAAAAVGSHDLEISSTPLATVKVEVSVRQIGVNATMRCTI
ncbi:hypothetical protein EDD16DRAFT_1725033 [Pisolithus croceorrhizus]|nr:hypothetical protein EDD16DRAFT_1725033 [Pisolithus croceorrhizus]